MKTLTQHIAERLQLNKDRIKKYDYKYFPETKKELGSIMDEIIRQNKNERIIDLNCIDTSEITDMGWLFYYDRFIYDISRWDVSNVENMDSMFYYTKQVDCDISNWNVSRVENMENMFTGSDFNGDISRWNVSHVKDMSGMFKDSKFNQDISKWDVSNVEHMCYMFNKSKFNQDLTPWKSKIKNKEQLQYIKDYIK